MKATHKDDIPTHAMHDSHQQKAKADALTRPLGLVTVHDALATMPRAGSFKHQHGHRTTPKAKPRNAHRAKMRAGHEKESVLKRLRQQLERKRKAQQAASDEFVEKVFYDQNAAAAGVLIAIMRTTFIIWGANYDIENDWDLMPFDDGDVEMTEDPRKGLIARVKSWFIKVRRGMTIDSGAADHVIPPDWIPGFVTKPSLGSKRGGKYVAANGSRIPNRGQMVVAFENSLGTAGKILSK